MKIDRKLMSEAVKDFKQFGTVTYLMIMRRHKVSLEMAQEICQEIEKRFPNLWRDRKNNHLNKVLSR